ncbi:MAG: hypothetical protein WCT16_03440 [Candidatus Buchananbacteria bacterium]
MKKVVFLILAVVFVTGFLLTGCATGNNNQVDVIGHPVYFYVESAKLSNDLPDIYEIIVIGLSRSDAIKKAEIHEKIMKRLSIVSNKRQAINEGNPKELLKWGKEFKREKKAVDRLYNDFFAVSGPSKTITLSSNEALFLSPGMVLRGDFIKEEVIDNGGMIKVTRNNFYRWTIVY